MLTVDRDQKVVKILSISGGGIKGIIPALVLKELEKKLKAAKKNTSFWQIFDLIAGTSTGGLISLGLTAPKKGSQEQLLTIQNLIDIYQKKGLQIFPRRIFNSLRSVKQIFDEKYQASSLEGLLLELFGQTTLDQALTNLLITSYDIENRKPFFFKKRPILKETQKDPNFYYKDIGRAITAAPTYFEAAQIQTIETNEQYSLIDGAVFANNPVLCAYTEAKKIYPNAKKYIVVSLGTGLTNTTYPYKKAKKWGALDWIAPWNGTPLLNVMMDGQNDNVCYQLERLPLVDFFCFDIELPADKDSLDDASEENINLLSQKAGELLDVENEQLDRLVEVL